MAADGASIRTTRRESNDPENGVTMFSLELPEPRTFLCLGAHCDDIEIGCGGALAQWARRYPNARLVWAVFSGNAERIAETRAAAAALLGSSTRVEIVPHDFRDSHFPAQLAGIKEAVEALSRQVDPSVVLTHHEHDRHQDHRVICELTWNTFRNHLILEYEIPKYDGDLGRPNVFIPLAAELARAKADTLVETFRSQRGRDWFTPDLFTALMRLRGIECRSPSGFAEGFFARKLVLAG
jgi:LmbE family N-acetylglucosaminyl deacetylase